MSNVTKTEPPVPDVTLGMLFSWINFLSTTSSCTRSRKHLSHEKETNTNNRRFPFHQEGQDFNEVTITLEFESGVNNTGIKIVGDFRGPRCLCLKEIIPLGIKTVNTATRKAR
jgi:hypothetical protein